MRRVVVIFLIALGAGGMAGYFSRSQAKVERDVETKRSVREERVARDRSADDLLRLTADGIRETREKGSSPLARKLADWTTEEIRAALEESVRSPDSMFRISAGSRVENALMAEWMRRDHKQAVAWFEGMESDYAKARLAAAMSNHWPAEDAMAGLDFVIRNRALFLKNPPHSLYTKIINQAAEGGAAALENALRRLREEKLTIYQLNPPELPGNFDFGSFVSGKEFAYLESSGQGSVFVSEWSAQDPEGAYQWLLAKGGMKEVASMAGMYGKEPERRLKWLGGEMSGWTEEERKEFLPRAMDRWRSNPEALKHLAEGVKDPVLADELRVHSIQAIYYQGKAQKALEVLSGIADPARRIELLLTKERAAGGGDGPPLSPAGEHTMRTVLPEWNATPEQIEAIIERFKQQ